MGSGAESSGKNPLPAAKKAYCFSPSSKKRHKAALCPVPFEKIKPNIIRIVYIARFVRSLFRHYFLLKNRMFRYKIIYMEILNKQHIGGN